MSLVRRHLSDVAGLGIACLWPWLYYLPVTLGQQVFAEGDINWLFSPIRTELARALSEGRLPLWSPGLEGGFPLFAEGEVAALYPLNVVAYRLLPVYVANSYTVLFNFMWASIGMFLLARSSRFRVVSALLASLVFGSSGFMAAQLSHLPHVAAASWLPWLILILQKYWRDRLAGRPTTLWCVLACCSIGLLCLSGFPQIAMINLAAYALSGFLGPILWDSRTNTVHEAIETLVRWLPRTASVIVTTILVGLGIGAVQLLPTFELMGLSIRGQELGESFFKSYSLDSAYLTQLLLPFWQMGAPHPFNMEFWGYVGVLPFVLVLVAIVLRRDSTTLFLAVLALLGLALALGGNNPLYDWLYNVPLFNRLRVPSRFLFLFTFAAAYLAAAGLEALLQRVPNLPKRDWIGLVCGVLFLLLVSETIVQAYAQPIEVWMGVWQWLPFVLGAACIGLLLVVRFCKPSAFLLGTLALGLTIFDLAGFRAPFVQALSGLTLPSEWVQAPRTAQSMDSTNPLYRVLVEKRPWTPAAIRGSMWTNIALLYGKQGAKSYLPSLALKRNDTFVDAMTSGMRNLMNVRYYLLPLEVPDYDGSIPSPLDESEPDGGLTIELLRQQPAIAPTRVVQLQVTSYTDHTGDMPNGQLVGEIVLGSRAGSAVTLPIRLGEETADWAWDALAQSGGVKHGKPTATLSFPAYLKSFGRTFTGHRYEARYDVGADQGPLIVTSVGVRSSLAGADLAIEHIDLIDETAHVTSLAALLHRNDLHLAFRSHTTAMWENRDVLPRAFVVHRAETMPDERALARLMEPDFPFDQVALLADTPLPDLARDNKETEPNDRVSIASYDPERVVIRVETNQPGFLVLSDSWYPGWATSIDEEPTPLYRADYIFRAVAVPSGKHTIVFEYRPVSFLWGAIISVMSLVLGAGLLFWLRGKTWL